MRELLRDAETRGWKAALEMRKEPRCEAVLDLVVNPRRSNFLDLLPAPKGDVAIDIGCGYGGISLQLTRNYREVFGLDSGLERLQFLNIVCKQEKIRDLHPMHLQDVTSLPFATESADLVVLVGVFEYLPLSYPSLSIGEVQHRVLRELHRVLKPGGYLYLGTKNRFGWPYLRGAMDHNRLRFGPVLPRNVAERAARILYHKPYRIVVDSLPSYRKMLRMAGFAAPSFFWPLPGYQAPERFAHLEGSPRFRSTVEAGQLHGWKAIVLPALSRFGLLKYVVPHFSIIAGKS
jgi:SAM-dependent methyltransferase